MHFRLYIFVECIAFVMIISCNFVFFAFVIDLNVNINESYFFSFFDCNDLTCIDFKSSFQFLIVIMNVVNFIIRNIFILHVCINIK